MIEAKKEETIQFFFKEQWWFISALCKINDEIWNARFIQKNFDADEKNKIYSYSCDQEEMDKKLNAAINGISSPDRFKKFVKEQKDRLRIVSICQNLNIESRWYDYIQSYEYYDFVKKQKVVYKSLGFFGFRVRLKPNSTINGDEILPNDMQQVTFAFFDDLKKFYSKEFEFDNSSPYVFSICDRYKTVPSEPKLIEWNKAKRDQYKKGIGEWVEIYSGQYDDYNDELFTYRTETNLSNRLSELHYVMRNSAFIYMNPDNYNKFFIKESKDSESSGYMYKNVVVPVVQIRTLLFGILHLNNIIDEDTKTLAIKKEKENRRPEEIKFDLDYTLRLKNTLQSVISPVFSDLNKNNRQHYARIMNHALTLFGIDNNWSLIQKKIDSNMVALENIYLDKQREMQQKQEEAQKEQAEAQEKAAQRQQAMLTLLQLILGTGVIFDILVDTIDSRVDLRSSVMITIVIIAMLAIPILRRTYSSELKDYEQKLTYIQIASGIWIVGYYFICIIYYQNKFLREAEWILFGFGMIVMIYILSISKRIHLKTLKENCEEKPKSV